MVVRSGQHAVEVDAELARRIQEAGRTGASEAELVDLVARELFERAVRAGGGESDIGLFGPRLFRRDARVVVDCVLGRQAPPSPRDTGRYA